MSEKQASDFIRDLTTDGEMAAALESTVDGLSEQEAYAEVARFAQARGYALDAEQARGIREAALQGRDGELDDQALESVAGGFMGDIFTPGGSKSSSFSLDSIFSCW